MRQESAEAMAQLIQASPDMMRVIGDLWVKNQDWPGAQEMSDRLKLALLPEIQKAEQSKAKVPPEAAPILQQMEIAIQQREQALKMMNQELQQLTQENEQLKAGTAVKAQEVQIKAQELQVDAYDAETRRIAALLAAEAKENDLDIRVQESVSKRLDQLLANELRTENESI